MQARRKRIDRCSITNETYFRAERVRQMREHLSKIDADPERKERRAKAECPSCHYGPGRVGGCACTTWECAFCGEGDLHNSTAVPVACVKCATAASVCRQCGADIDLRERRRKFDLPPVVASGEGE